MRFRYGNDRRQEPAEQLVRVVLSGRDDDGVQRSTTIRHLVEMAEVATERMGLRQTDIDWPLEEIWVTGERACRGWPSIPPANG